MRIGTVLAFIIISSLVGCKEKSFVNGLSGGTLSAEINGSHFEADGVHATRTPGSTGIGEGFTVEGNGDSGFPSITLSLYSKNIGKYNLGVSGTGNTNAIFLSSPGNPEASTAGSISIENVDYSEGGVVKGSFKFVTAADSISNGSFEIRFSN